MKTPTISFQRSKLKQIINTINPFASGSKASFHLHLHQSVDQTIRDFLRKVPRNSRVSRRVIKATKIILDKSDTRDLLTLYVQNVTNTKEKDQTMVNLLVALKFASVAAIYPINYVGARQKLQIAKPFLHHLALQAARLYNQNFALELENVLQNQTIDEKLAIFQKLDSNHLSDVKKMYFSNYNRLAILIAKHLKSLKVSNTLANLPIKIVEYQVVFNEITAYLNNPKTEGLVKMIGFNEMSKIATSNLNEINQTLQDAQKAWGLNYITHISETSERIRLSDLPPLSPLGVMSLLVSYCLLIFWAAIILLPIFQMVILSFDGSRANYFTENPTFNRSPFFHYQMLLTQTHFLSWLKNSLLVAFSTMLIVIVMTTLLAYAFSRFKFKGRKSSIMTIMLLQMVPAVAGLTALLIMFNIFSEALKINLNLFLVIIYSGGAITGNTFILRGYFDSIPHDLDEAAKTDGANNFQTFWEILVPLAKPMMALVALWSFIGPFGDVILPELLSAGTSDSIPQLTMAAGLRTLIVGDGTGGGVFQFAYLAGALITSLPITLMFILAQRFLVSGLTSGAVK